MKEHTIFLSGPDKLFAAAHSGDKVKPLILNQRGENEAAHTNPTSLPDNILLSLQPIFQIRHPVLMFPSMLRAQSQTMPETNTNLLRVSFSMTLRPTRALYDWYRQHGGELIPRVIDADDIMNDRAAVRQLCIETGLDPEAVQYEWEERHEDNPLLASFLSTIYASKGIVPGLTSAGLSVDDEKTKWQAEFGDDIADGLAKLVNDAMPDYNYLLSRRTRSEDGNSSEV